MLWLDRAPVVAGVFQGTEPHELITGGGINELITPVAVTANKRIVRNCRCALKCERAANCAVVSLVEV